MLTNGNKIREAIARWELKKEIRIKEFDKSFTAKSEDIAAGRNKAPSAIMNELRECEDAIAVLETIQATYNINTKVKVSYNGTQTSMTLTEAVKRIGGASRVEGMWKKQAKADADPWESHRQAYPDRSYPVRTMALDEVLNMTTKAGNYAGALRSAIAEGNVRELDVDAPASLFE